MSFLAVAMADYKEYKREMKRTRISTVLNIIGMSASLMVFLVLFSQVWFDYRFNRNFEDYENIYRFEHPTEYDGEDFPYDQLTYRPLIEAFESCSPDVLVACDYEDCNTNEANIKTIVNDNGNIRKFDMPYAMADSSLPDVFSLNFMAGSATDFCSANDVIIAESWAKEMFGNGNPIGMTLTQEMSDEVYKIVAVYEDLPENCSIINGMIINEGDMDLTLPNYYIHVGFFRLRDGASVDKVLEDFRKTYSSHVRSIGFDVERYEKEIIPDIRLTPIAQTHFLDDIRSGQKPSANPTQTIILLSIAFIFLLISIFNYINFSMASIPFKINDINIEKVFGASRKRLIFNQLKESTLIVIISFALALVMMEAVSRSQFASFSCCSLAVTDNITAILICFSVALTAAVTGGIITALYSTSFAPGTVLKGAFTISGTGVVFRRISLIAQYVMSCIFLICGLMISRQTSFMLEKDNGFNTEHIIHTNANLWFRWHECFDKISENPEILEVTCGESPMNAGLSSRSALRSKDNEQVWYSIRRAYYNYFDFFDFKLAEGRFPNEGEFGVAVINETFATTYPDYNIGSRMWNRDGTQYEIIGIVKDFNARPLMHKTEPMVYFMDNMNYCDMFFRLKSDNISETIKWIENVMRGRLDERGADASQVTLTTTFLDNDIENMYQKEIGQSKLITTSSLLCMLIALIGVLGIVYFETRVMKKEIAIRKVNGATTREIIKSISMKYILICTIGFVIAIPVSLHVLNWWLSGFAYRTNISIWILILAYLTITALTALTVIIRSYSAASENPVDALKME